MRPLLVVLCLVASACAAGLEYGGLTTLLPSPAPSPAPSYALAAPGTELYFTWTVAEPSGSEWYSFSFTIDADTTGLCIDVAPAGQLSIGADCKSCRSVGQQVFMPQPGQWLARITNCLAPSPASSGAKILPVVLTAVICPPGMYGPLCESPITQLVFNQTAEIAVQPTDAPRYFSYSFDQSAGPVSWVSFYHNLTYNPVNPGAPGYSIVEMAPSVLAPQVFKLGNDYEGADYLDIDPSWAPPDYNVASPLGRNVIAVVPSSPAGTSPATHALTLMAEAIICTPPYFGEHQKVTCPYFFSGAVAVDPTQALQTLTVTGSFNANDIHSHSGGSTRLYKFYNITLPMTANLLSVTRTGGDATVSLAYHTIGSAYSQTRAQFVAQPGVWVLGVTSQTNSSFELVVTVEACPDACSKQGICEIATSSCYCIVGFLGPICQSVELITESVTVTVPPSSWAFYEVLVSRTMDTIEIGFELSRDPAQRVVAFVSYAPFAVTTLNPLHLPFPLNNATNSFSYPHPTIGSWNVAIYNSAGRSEDYLITSNAFVPVGPTNPPNPNRNGVNVVTVIVILFVGVFIVTLAIAAWIRWAAARGGYVSIQ